MHGLRRVALKAAPMPARERTPQPLADDACPHYMPD
jgi:hypothetical protein